MSLSLADARAEALFASDVQPSQQPNPAAVAAAIQATVRRLHVAGCAACVAQEFGDHPDIAANRMRWARTTTHIPKRADGAGA